MITILDYGAGNLRSVQNTLDELGAQYRLVRDRGGIAEASKILLPGVGHFGQMMRALDELDVRSILSERLTAGVPFLGICLGLHALFTDSEEAPEMRGLDLLPGTVRRFPPTARVPHMGWNTLEAVRPSRLMAGLPAPAHVYFAHSYYVPISAATTARTDYAEPCTSLLEYGNLYGVQFHPEKSGPVGLRLVRNFVELA